MRQTVVTFLIALVGAMAFSACDRRDSNLYQGPAEEEKPSVVEDLGGPEYAEQFSNFDYFQAKITSSFPYGRFYSVFLEYPYNESMDLVVQPILSGLTPIDGKFVVPKGVEKLYVLNDDGVKEYPVGNLTISDATTRADLTDSEFNTIKKYIDNSVLPEAQYNIRGEELYSCTDLYAKDIEDDEVVNVWVSLVRNNDVPGPVWYYIYTGQEPTIDDVTFYGGGESPLSWTDIYNRQPNYIMNKNTAIKKEIELPVTLKKGQKLGFVYFGNLGWRFTTPSLNTPENTKHPNYSAHNTLGCEIPYNPAVPFVITKPVLGGAMFHFTCEGKEYNVVGFENRLPGEKTNGGNYDGDYNDMVFLVRSNPEKIKPEIELPPADIKFKTTRRGVWLFEDNYPEKGDFDFNDVVVYYEAQICGNEMKLNCWLAARGCNFKNEVGIMRLSSANSWKNPIEKIPLWKNVNGYMNVGDDSVVLTNVESITETLSCNDFQLLRPYLDNGSGQITLETYNTTEYPYAIDVPSYIANPKNNQKVNTAFCWPKEGKSIDDCYYFTKNSKGGDRDVNWYMTPKNKNLVIQFK